MYTWIGKRLLHRTSFSSNIDERERRWTLNHTPPCNLQTHSVICSFPRPASSQSNDPAALQPMTPARTYVRAPPRRGERKKIIPVDIAPGLQEIGNITTVLSYVFRRATAVTHNYLISKQCEFWFIYFFRHFSSCIHFDSFCRSWGKAAKITNYQKEMKTPRRPAINVQTFKSGGVNHQTREEIFLTTLLQLIFYVHSHILLVHITRLLVNSTPISFTLLYTGTVRFRGGKPEIRGDFRACDISWTTQLGTCILFCWVTHTRGVQSIPIKVIGSSLNLNKQSLQSIYLQFPTTRLTCYNYLVSFHV